jgi:hypothetical protein
MFPRTPRPGQPVPEFPSASEAPSEALASGFGTIALRVQPADADILIDGERWTLAALGERLLVQVPEGRHHVEIQKSGYRPFSTDITVQHGETAPLNVSLSSQN